MLCNAILDVGMIVFISWIISLSVKEYKLIRQHQKQWNGIKAEFKDLDEKEQYKIYRAFNSTLENHFLLGKCLPYFDEEDY